MKTVTYFVSTQSKTERESVVSALRKRGYKLGHIKNLETLNVQFPHNNWPIVKFNTGNTVIDFLGIPPNEFAIALPASTIARAGQLNIIPTAPKTLPTPTGQLPATVVFPEAAKYKMVYRKLDGKIGKYTVSNPIETKGNKFIAYAFGKGVKSFLIDRVKKFEKVQ